MEIAVKGNEEKIAKMERMLFESKDKKTSVGVSFDYKDGKYFHYKKDLTDHIKQNHERIYNKTEVESVQLGNTYIADMDKCPQDKRCLDKCCGDSCKLLYMFPGPFF